jgi:cation diffusion facilitator family transporter
MASPSSRLVIAAAITGNLAVAVTKFVAAAFTGSAAMLAEGIHSLVDTGDGLLVLLGMHLSRRPPDETHPFGHGLDLYFWTLIVAILIFAVGGGMSVLEGILHLLDPAPLENPAWNYAVLGLAAVFERAAWGVALKGFVAVKGTKGIWEAVHESKDPTKFVVLFEDTAALLGLLIAFLGILLGQLLGIPSLDGLASILIGLILAAVAVVLAYESRGLLLGESADPKTVASIRALAEADSAVERVRHPLTMHFGPEQVLLNLDVQFRRGLSAPELEPAVDRLEAAIRARHPQIKHIFLEGDAIRARPGGGAARDGAPAAPGVAEGPRQSCRGSSTGGSATGSP